MKIILMGTSDFVMPSFKALAKDNEIIAVYTTAPKPVGRGGKIQKSEPHIWAESLGIPVETPKTLKSAEEIEIFKNYAKKSDVAVICVYGLYIPDEMIKSLKYGVINIHPSLLPKYRGSSPIYSAILNGDSETGVSIMQVDSGFDTGDVLKQSKIKINEYETFGSLYDRLSNKSADLIIETIDNINCLSPIKQDDLGEEASYTKKLTREDEKIVWDNSSLWVFNRIRGLNPTPKASAISGGKEYKIIESRLSEITDNKKSAGEIISIEKDGVNVKCGDGKSVKITKIQPAGKKIMSMVDFLRGQKNFKGFER